MTKQFAAIVAAVAGAALIGIAGPAAAKWESEFPMSVNDAGPVQTAEQQRYEADRNQDAGVAGRPGYAMDADLSTGAFYEVKTPSKGGPIDD